MKLRVVAVGHRMPDWVQAGFTEYARRMPPELRVELVEIKPERRAGADTGRLLAAEKGRIEAQLAAPWVALDERGQALTTRGLADWLRTCLAGGEDWAFLIGGADGLHPDLKARARKVLSLSALTLPHGLARVVLAEQLYRAATLLQGHPYHRD